MNIDTATLPRAVRTFTNIEVQNQQINALIYKMNENEAKFARERDDLISRIVSLEQENKSLKEKEHFLRDRVFDLFGIRRLG